MVHWVADLIPRQNGINITEWVRAVNTFDLEGFYG